MTKLPKRLSLDPSGLHHRHENLRWDSAATFPGWPHLSSMSQSFVTVKRQLHIHINSLCCGPQRTGHWQDRLWCWARETWLICKRRLDWWFKQISEDLRCLQWSWVINHFSQEKDKRRRSERWTELFFCSLVIILWAAFEPHHTWSLQQLSVFCTANTVWCGKSNHIWCAQQAWHLCCRTQSQSAYGFSSSRSIQGLIYFSGKISTIESPESAQASASNNEWSSGL